MNVLRASMSEVDPAIRDLVDRESRRQEEGLELIASENYVPRAVLEAQGSILTNKYAEGYPGRKYYGGCEHVEEIERIAVDRAKSLFGAEHANVQPHSGTSANMAVLLAALDPGDPILAMRLDQGGHLSHGHHLSFAGQLYEGIAYGVRRDTETIDYEEVERLARERRPRMIVAGASAYPRFIDFERFRRIADETGALLWVDMAHIAGLVAGGVHPNPVPLADFVTTTTHKTLRGPRGAIAFCRASSADALDRSVFPGVQGGPLVHVIAAKAICLSLAAAPEFRAYAERVRENARVLAEALAERGFRIVSGGTDNHLILVDLRPKGISGVQAERILGEAGITVNKNLIPFDPERPAVTSGIRLGTPALTTRGLGPEEMRSVAEAIDRILSRPEDESERLRVRSLVRDLARSFPLDFSRP